MWFTEKERVAFTVLGMLALAALGILLWQRQRPALTIMGTPVAPEQAVPWDAALASARHVDINTASAAELERLPGVGPTLARRITDDRATHGPFVRPEDLQRVKGIGPQTYDAFKDYVTVNE